MVKQLETMPRVPSTTMFALSRIAWHHIDALCIANGFRRPWAQWLGNKVVVLIQAPQHNKKYEYPTALMQLTPQLLLTPWIEQRRILTSQFERARFRVNAILKGKT